MTRPLARRRQLRLVRDPGLRPRSRRLGVLTGVGFGARNIRPVVRVFRTQPSWPRAAGRQVVVAPASQLTLRVGITMPSRPSNRQHTVQATPAVRTVRSWATPPPAGRVPAPAPARMTLLVERAARTPVGNAAATAAGRAANATPLLAGRVPSTFPGSGPRPVGMVHHVPGQPAPAGNPSVRTPVNEPSPRLSVRWDDRPAGDMASPLTTRDVPGVVDKVVREIEGRLSADRERRGWPG